MSPPATWPISSFCSCRVLDPCHCPALRVNAPNHEIVPSRHRHFFRIFEYAWHNPSRAMVERKIGRRACNGCKIRKVKCSEVPPCKSCISARIECTFPERRGTRGPKSLRPKTLRSITQTGPKSNTAVGNGCAFADGSAQSRIDVPASPSPPMYVSLESTPE